MLSAINSSQLLLPCKAIKYLGVLFRTRKRMHPKIHPPSAGVPCRHAGGIPCIDLVDVSLQKEVGRIKGNILAGSAMIGRSFI